MRRISLPVCILLFTLLVFSGCGSGSSETADTDDTLVSIKSNGETILPYLRFSWGSTWTSNGWLEADALQLIGALPEIAQELPTVRYNGDFTMQCNEGVSFTDMSIYDDSFELLHLNVDLSYMEKLPEGTYYVGIAVVQRGKYIESENQYENQGYDCVLKLVVGE